MKNKKLAPTDAVFYLLGKIFFVVFGMAVCVGPFVWDKVTALFPKCYFLDAVGLYCPGCGGTRAILSLLQFRLWESFCYHPAVLYGAVVYLLFMLGCFYRKHFEKTVIGIIPIEQSMYIGIAIILLQFVVKNFCLIVYQYSWI